MNVTEIESFPFERTPAIPNPSWYSGVEMNKTSLTRIPGTENMNSAVEFAGTAINGPIVKEVWYTAEIVVEPAPFRSKLVAVAAPNDGVTNAGLFNVEELITDVLITTLLIVPPLIA